MQQNNESNVARVCLSERFVQQDKVGCAPKTFSICMEVSTIKKIKTVKVWNTTKKS